MSTTHSQVYMFDFTHFKKILSVCENCLHKGQTRRWSLKATPLFLLKSLIFDTCREFPQKYASIVRELRVYYIFADEFVDESRERKACPCGRLPVLLQINRRTLRVTLLFWGTCPWVSVFRGTLIPHYPDG